MHYQKHSEETKQQIRLAKLGTHHSEETKLKISLHMKGIKNRLGVVGSDKQKEIASLTHTGEKNVNWKGDNVSYRNLHRWVERKLGKANKCMIDLTHKSSRYHWANVSHQYKRDLDDWIQMCPSCNGLDRIGRRVSP